MNFLEVELVVCACNWVGLHEKLKSFSFGLVGLFRWVVSLGGLVVCFSWVVWLGVLVVSFLEEKLHSCACSWVDPHERLKSNQFTTCTIGALTCNRLFIVLMMICSSSANVSHSDDDNDGSMMIMMMMMMIGRMVGAVPITAPPLMVIKGGQPSL